MKSKTSVAAVAKAGIEKICQKCVVRFPLASFLVAANALTERRAVLPPANVKTVAIYTEKDSNENRRTSSDQGKEQNMHLRAASSHRYVF